MFQQLIALVALVKGHDSILAPTWWLKPSVNSCSKGPNILRHQRCRQPKLAKLIYIKQTFL